MPSKTQIGVLQDRVTPDKRRTKLWCDFGQGKKFQDTSSWKASNSFRLKFSSLNLQRRDTNLLPLIFTFKIKLCYVTFLALLQIALSEFVGQVLLVNFLLVFGESTSKTLSGGWKNSTGGSFSNI